MGIYDRDYYQDRQPGVRLGMPHSIVGQLILANVAVFLATVLTDPKWISNTFALWPSDLTQPWMWWRLLTYGFLHDSSMAMHIVSNMLGLFFFGREIETIYGPRKFLGFYLTAIIVSGFVWLLLAQPLGKVAPVIGASGAVTAVVMLFIFHYPHRTVLMNMLIPVPAWVMGGLLILYNMVGLRSPGNRIAFDVHLAGAAYAWLFFRTQWEFGSLLGAGGWKISLPRRKPSLKIHDPARSAGSARSVKPSESLAEQADAILDKLHREGESSLNARERRILEDYSRSVRNRRD
ncbi:MAG: rhomboid family intramembrane serine protease [Pirellulales bacterium]